MFLLTRFVQSGHGVGQYVQGAAELPTLSLRCTLLAFDMRPMQQITGDGTTAWPVVDSL